MDGIFWEGVDECLLKGFHPTPFHRHLQIHSFTQVILPRMENLIWKVMGIEADLLLGRNLKLVVYGKKLRERGGAARPWPLANEFVCQGLEYSDKVVDDGWVDTLCTTNSGGEKSNVGKEKFVVGNEDTTIIEERLVEDGSNMTPAYEQLIANKVASIKVLVQMMIGCAFDLRDRF